MKQRDYNPIVFKLGVGKTQDEAYAKAKRLLPNGAVEIKVENQQINNQQRFTCRVYYDVRQVYKTQSLNDNIK